MQLKLFLCRLNISDYIQSSEHIQLAHDMATQTMVLLKNDQSKGLPITSPLKKACVSQTYKYDKQLINVISQNLIPWMSLNTFLLTFTGNRTLYWHFTLAIWWLLSKCNGRYLSKHNDCYNLHLNRASFHTWHAGGVCCNSPQSDYE